MHVFLSCDLRNMEEELVKKSWKPLLEYWVQCHEAYTKQAILYLLFLSADQYKVSPCSVLGNHSYTHLFALPRHSTWNAFPCAFPTSELRLKEERISLWTLSCTVSGTDLLVAMKEWRKDRQMETRIESKTWWSSYSFGETTVPRNGQCVYYVQLNTITYSWTGNQGYYKQISKEAGLMGYCWTKRQIEC